MDRELYEATEPHQRWGDELEWFFGQCEQMRAVLLGQPAVKNNRTLERCVVALLKEVNNILKELARKDQLLRQFEKRSEDLEREVFDLRSR
jgi:hypothetical protein